MTPMEEYNFSLIRYIEVQRAWSGKTFGPGTRTLGIIEHIRKELKEIEDAPRDIEEWVDVMILAFDGAWRAGYTPQDIATALRWKQQTNFDRKWPDRATLRQDEATEHVRG